MEGSRRGDVIPLSQQRSLLYHLGPVAYCSVF